MPRSLDSILTRMARAAQRREFEDAVADRIARANRRARDFRHGATMATSGTKLGAKGASTYETIEVFGLTQARAKLKVERAVTSQLELARRSIHDHAQAQPELHRVLTTLEREAKQSYLKNQR